MIEVRLVPELTVLGTCDIIPLHVDSAQPHLVLSVGVQLNEIPEPMHEHCCSTICYARNSYLTTDDSFTVRFHQGRSTTWSLRYKWRHNKQYQTAFARIKSQTLNWKKMCEWTKWTIYGMTTNSKLSPTVTIEVHIPMFWLRRKIFFGVVCDRFV